MNFFKIICKYLKGKHLTNGETSSLDNFFNNLKIGFVTILLLIILSFLFYYLIDLGISFFNTKTNQYEI